MILAGDFIPKSCKINLPNAFKHQQVLANLEGPICADELPISDKVGVCLHTTPSETLFDSIRTFAFSLANNHMMDFRDEGLRQTKAALEGHGISYAGAGENEVDARAPMILEDDGKRIAVFCCCERQFGVAADMTAGCAEMGVWLFRAIREVKDKGIASHVIVSCHAASEFSPWVSPTLRDFYHSLIDVGADCIHGHHAHVPQGYEEYRKRPIFYGLGNFVVNIDDWGMFPHFRWSNVANVHFESEGVIWSIEPYCLSRQQDEVVCQRATGDQKALYDHYLSLVNRSFESERNVLMYWQESACRLYPWLYEQTLRIASSDRGKLSVRDRLRKLFFATGDVVRALLGREIKTRKSIYYAKVAYNCFNCSSHVDLIRTALGVRTGTIHDVRTKESACIAKEIMVR